MRPIASFVLHALAAAALTALAATSAAAQSNSSLVDASFEDADGNYVRGHKEEFTVQSFSFGEVKQVTKVDGFAMNQDVKPAALAGTPQSVRGVTVAAGDANADGPTEKRQHGWTSLSKPPDRGSVTVKGKLPGCNVGAAYPDAVLQTATARYEFKETIITGCAMDSVSFNYTQVQVRGRDPTKKKE